MRLMSTVKCPYCGYIHSEKWFCLDDDWMELECADCKRKFIADNEIKVTTSKVWQDREEYQ